MHDAREGVRCPCSNPPEDYQCRPVLAFALDIRCSRLELYMIQAYLMTTGYPTKHVLPQCSNAD